MRRQSEGVNFHIVLNVPFNYINYNYPCIFREDFSKGANLDSLVASMLTTGFQATNVALAIEEINKMVILIHFSR